MPLVGSARTRTTAGGGQPASRRLVVRRSGNKNCNTARGPNEDPDNDDRHGERFAGGRDEDDC